ncbi:uncharacterized protein LOC124915073 [Impatiens glandulifera]|uniref:uncharacterized protein LOC124915073 n=1 Tax=Impatiens glandulifera TaxID=253017 RepID=UPI001FB0B64D|nr:uncharacterized protein LOC124915073 [Impatiens glandulifera]
MLHSAASFSVYATGEGEKDGAIAREIMLEYGGGGGGDDGGVERSVTTSGDRRREALASFDSGEFSFGKNNAMDLLLEEDEEAFGHGQSDVDIEEYFKKMVTQNPSNALFLRNYAHLLQSKGELERAEEYYLKATIADPEDGEILLLYAKLIWELHHDYKIASDYFHRAALAAPNDSNILAEFARFLWEAGEESEDDEDEPSQLPLAAPAPPAPESEEYFEMAIQTNPNDSNTLAAYARFLWETDCQDEITSK